MPATSAKTCTLPPRRSGRVRARLQRTIRRPSMPYSTSTGRRSSSSTWHRSASESLRIVAPSAASQNLETIEIPTTADARMEDRSVPLLTLGITFSILQTRFHDFDAPLHVVIPENRDPSGGRRLKELWGGVGGTHDGAVRRGDNAMGIRLPEVDVAGAIMYGTL